MEIKIYRSYNEFLELEENWKTLLKNKIYDNPFLTWGWNKEWLKAYKINSKLSIIEINEEDRTVLLAPLAYDKRKVFFYCEKLFADYVDILSPNLDNFLISEMFKTINKIHKWRKIILSTIPETSSSIKLIENFLKINNKHFNINCVSKNPFVKTSGIFEDYYNSLKKNLKQEIRTTVNKLNKIGDWKYLHANNDQTAIDIFDKLVEFHLYRQKDKPCNSIFMEEKNRIFFRSLLSKKKSDFIPHISAIICNGEIVSAAYSIYTGRTLFYWIPSFKNFIKGTSLGKLHIKCLLEDCFNMEIDRFDFMGGNEIYKLQWTNESYNNYEICIYKYKIMKIIDNYSIFIKNYLIKIKRRSPFISSLWKIFSKYYSQ